MQTNYDIETIEREAHAIADSNHADKVRDQVRSAFVEVAETEFSGLLKLIQDADLRERIDSAVGRISYVYERLGFIEGFVSERTLADEDKFF